MAWREQDQPRPAIARFAFISSCIIETHSLPVIARRFAFYVRSSRTLHSSVSLDVCPARLLANPFSGRCIPWLDRFRQSSFSPARRSKTTPKRKGMMNGTAGIPTIKPGLVYHGVALPFGYRRPLVTRNSNATKVTRMNARVAPRPSHWTRPREAANAAVAR